MSPASSKARTTTAMMAGAAMMMAVAVAVAGAAAFGTVSPASAATAKIPSGAMGDHTGITSTTVRVGNVSTLAVGGLFKGALVGTEAYADFVNSTGGVNGRKIEVDSGDDGSTGTGNKQETQIAIANDFALVGGFSLQDNAGGAVLKANPGMADVTMVLDSATGHLPNVFEAVPLLGGWQEGPLQYYKKKFPNAVKAVGTIVSNMPSAEEDWAGEEYVMQHVGYKVVYDPTIPLSPTDFTANVIAMEHAGVKILFLDQLPQSDA